MAFRRPAVTAYAIVDDQLAYLRFVKHARRADPASALQAASEAIVAHWKFGLARLLDLPAGSGVDPAQVAATAQSLPAGGLRIAFDIARGGGVSITAERTLEGVAAGRETNPLCIARGEALVVAHILEYGLLGRCSPVAASPALSPLLAPAI